MSRYFLLVAGLLLFSCNRHRSIPDHNLVYLQIGDSITAGEKNTPGHTPGDYATQALGATTFIKLGWRGENIKQFTVAHRQQLLDSLASIPDGHRIVLGIAYGANDLNVNTKEQALANIVRVARWAHDTAHVAQVLIVPCLNRTDKWGFTREADGSESHHFNESRLWLNKQLHSQAAAWPWARVANESDSPAMYADDYPADKKRCADEVHPNDFGAQELGTGTIAHGIARFKLK